MPSFALKLTACLFAAVSGLAQSTAAPAPLAFDVASVRPSLPGGPQRTNVPLDAGYVYGSVSADDTRNANGGSFSATHQPLWRYIVFAYKLSATQEMALRFSIYSGVPKSGAPFWVTGSFDASPEFFDISARAPAETTIDQMRLMMRTLLSERFHLALHFVTADAPAFALVLSKPGVTGPNLQPHPPADSCAAPTPSTPDQPASRPASLPSVVGELPPACGVIAHVPSAEAGMHYGGRAVALSLMATTLPTMTGLAAIPRPVVDETGLTGLYDFTLHWIQDPSGDEAVSDNIANFRDALRKQLGLELRSSHAPMNVVIVDHVERPSEN
jgi:uncharacterized protein (TIGR03435 family)